MYVADPVIAGAQNIIDRYLQYVSGLAIHPRLIPSHEVSAIPPQRGEVFPRRLMVVFAAREFGDYRIRAYCAKGSGHTCARIAFGQLAMALRADARIAIGCRTQEQVKERVSDGHPHCSYRYSNTVE
jgi:hypothetical protein